MGFCNPHCLLALLFTHGGLACMLVVYAIIGAAVFQAIEGQFEIRERIHLEEVRSNVLTTIWNITVIDGHEDMNFTSWSEQVRDIFREYEHEHRRSVIHGVSDVLPLRWTFSGSLFFACTVFTTIGYGHMAPETTEGRAFCMVYAFFGIPLLMLVLVDLGSLLARGTKFLYLKIFRPYINKNSGRVSCFERKEKTLDRQQSVVKKDVKVKSNVNEMGTPVNDTSKADHWKTDFGRDETVENQGDTEDNNNEDNEKKDEFDLPMLAILAFGFLYMCVLAALFSAWENWSYFECFYFSFITLSTIGFGDLIPEHQKFTIASSFFILLGMTVMTMCITLSQSKIEHSLKWMGWRIGIKPKPKETPDDGSIAA
ncbi:potassium channel subfamily K member 18-like [Saccoglossus kowalevskii]|uniref:Potassium channel subfamily K member 9-like n=1 Tax=Saccoglossus kowalevskii TaxID=10224 RepID=A0ABM0MXX2_SACKO|nr:PREDICTED: potassium channel subfamily K member 9-like [Saccoglossus kowalevskii]